MDIFNFQFVQARLKNVKRFAISDLASQRIDLKSEARSLDRLVLAAKLCEAEAEAALPNGFLLVGAGCQAEAMSPRLQEAATLFDLLSDVSCVDHPLCQER